jgi:hypothetical protein
MSEVIGRLGPDLRQLIEKSHVKVAVEGGLELKAREAHRRLNERMRLLADIEDAVRQFSTCAALRAETAKSRSTGRPFERSFSSGAYKLS